MRMSRKLITLVVVVGIPCLTLLLRLVVGLMQAMVLSQGTPLCARCGGQDMRRSQSSGVLDRLLRLLRCYPYRCRFCRTRFYRFGDALPVSAKLPLG